MGKGWFNLLESSKDAFELSKLKKYLTMVKIMMQDSLYTMTHKSLYKFVNTMTSFIPEIVEVNSPKDVLNGFAEISDENPVPPIPLIAIDIVKGGKMFTYSTDPEHVVEKVKMIFEEGLHRIKEIPVIEEVVMEHLFKKNSVKHFLNCPQIPKEQPIIPTGEEQLLGKLLEDNWWVWELKEKILTMMKTSIQPLYKYITVYDKYEEVMKLDVEKYIKEIQQKAGEISVEELRDEIHKHQELEKKILNEIPETIRVSCFEISCREVRSSLSGKHATFVKQITDQIGQIAKDTTMNLLENFKKMHRDISKPPKDVEELTEIKEMIERVPVDIEKMKVEIDNNMNTFSILDKFQYKFPTDELNKKWELFGFPKKTYEVITIKTEELEKQKIVFQEHTSTEQEEFREAIEELENIVKSFVQYTDINQYKETAEIVERVQKRLDECIANAKTFNNREFLFGVENTDYSQVHNCNKEFKPFADLWNTVNNWYGKYDH